MGFEKHGGAESEGWRQAAMASSNYPLSFRTPPEIRKGIWKIGLKDDRVPTGSGCRVGLVDKAALGISQEHRLRGAAMQGHRLLGSSWEPWKSKILPADSPAASDSTGRTKRFSSTPFPRLRSATPRLASCETTASSDTTANLAAPAAQIIPGTPESVPTPAWPVPRQVHPSLCIHALITRSRFFDQRRRVRKIVQLGRENRSVPVRWPRRAYSGPF